MTDIPHQFHLWLWKVWQEDGGVLKIDFLLLCEPLTLLGSKFFLWTQIFFQAVIVVSRPNKMETSAIMLQYETLTPPFPTLVDFQNQVQSKAA